MLCEENLEKVCIEAGNCQESILIDESSNVTGSAKLVWYFNGSKYSSDIELVEDEPILIPNNFNDNYKHTLKVILSDGSVYKDTLFLINIKPCFKKWHKRI